MKKRKIMDAALIPAMLGVSGAIAYGLFALIHRFQLSRCPADTFLAGSGRLAMIIQLIPTLLIAIWAGSHAVYVPANRMTWSDDDPVREEFRPTADDRRRQRARTLKLTGLLLLVTLPPILLAMFSQYCLTPSAIDFQPRAWSEMRRHSWREVSKIVTTCGRGSGGAASYVLHLEDGEDIDIWAFPERAAPVFPQIHDALRGVNPVFDAGGVYPKCSAPYAEFLTRAP